MLSHTAVVDNNYHHHDEIITLKQNDMEGIFAEIPNEIIFDQILVYFEYQWILQTARLICKLWNDHHKTIKTNQFRIKYRGIIEEINLIMNEHSDELYQVTELITHHIQGNYISIFKEFVSKLTNLQNLKLMTRDCDISIIEELVRLQNLKKIDLPNFTHFREFTKSTSRIKSITFSDPNSIPIEVDFSDLNWSLEEFICNCSLTSESIMSLLKNEILSKNLNKFKISYSELDENIMKEISTLSKLRELNLNSVKCGDALAQYISELENLESVFLYNNLIYGSGLSNFKNLTSITKLNIDYNSIDNEGANYLSSLTSLTDLSLRKNKISDEGLKNYSKLSNLSEINLSDNLIGSIGANYVSQIPNITSLNLYNNLIGEEGLKNFGNLSKLKTLYLEYNKIGNGLEYLSNCKQIEYLTVNSNNINEQSVIKYCEMKPLSVTYLNISNNPIGNSGFASLLQLPQLTSIEADSCGISDKGILEMLESLPKPIDFLIASCYVMDNETELNEIPQKVVEWLLNETELTSPAKKKLLELSHPNLRNYSQLKPVNYNDNMIHICFISMNEEKQVDFNNQQITFNISLKQSNRIIIACSQNIAIFGSNSRCYIQFNGDEGSDEINTGFWFENEVSECSTLFILSEMTFKTIHLIITSNHK